MSNFNKHYKSQLNLSAHITGLIILIALSKPCISAENIIPVANFGTSIQTDQGGFFRTIGGRPNQIIDQLIKSEDPLQNSWRIELTSESPQKEIGVLIPLFNQRPLQVKEFIGIQPASHLCMRLQGALGNRQLKIELVPGTNRHSQGIYLGNVSAEQCQGDSFSTLCFPVISDNNKSNIGFIRILADGEGPSWFAINSIAFADVPFDFPAVNTTELDRNLKTALWVWGTKEILPDSQQCEKLLQLCKDYAVTDLYFMVQKNRNDDRVRVTFENEQRNFNALAHAQGIKVHALAGQPNDALRKNHHRSINLIQAVQEFNSASASNQKFDGIHLDIEPHLLRKWKNNSTRQEVIQAYFDLNQRASKATRANGMAYGVDIPFWWDKIDEDGRRVYWHEGPDGDKPLLEAMFPLVDNIGIMSYRDRVTGRNGTVSHCLTEFDLGEQYSVDVFASVELGDGPRVERGISMAAYSTDYFCRQLKSLRTTLQHQAGCGGIAIHHFTPLLELGTCP